MPQIATPDDSWNGCMATMLISCQQCSSMSQKASTWSIGSSESIHSIACWFLSPSLDNKNRHLCSLYSHFLVSNWFTTYSLFPPKNSEFQISRCPNNFINLLITFNDIESIFWGIKGIVFALHRECNVRISKAKSFPVLKWHKDIFKKNKGCGVLF